MRGKASHQIRYAHEKLNIYHASESTKTIKKRKMKTKMKKWGNQKKQK